MSNATVPDPPGPGADSSASASDDMSLRQAVATAAGNALLTLVSVLLLWKGYQGGPHHIPRLFLWGEIGLMAALFAAARMEWITAAAIFLFRGCRLAPNLVMRFLRFISMRGSHPKKTIGPIEPPRWIVEWKADRGEDWKIGEAPLRVMLSLKGIMYLAATMNFFAMWDLVQGTGGGLESPFTPLLLAPAVLGVLIVMNLAGLFGLAAGALIAAFATDYTAPKRHYLVIRPNGVRREVVDLPNSLGHPHPWVYATVAVVLVLCTALVAGLGMASARQPQTIIDRVRERVAGGPDTPPQEPESFSAAYAAETGSE